MSKKDLKTKFETGKKPTGEDFAQFIDESVQDLSGLQEKGDYATKTELSKKADKAALSDKADSSELTDLATQASVNKKADSSELEALKARVAELESPK